MNDRMRRIHRIHLIGIGGSGVGGVAEVLLSLGYEVQGSDLKTNGVTQRLERLGAKIFIGHRAENLGGGAPVHAALRHVAFHLLLQAGDADLEKLIEVRADDAEELHALEQWRGGVERLIEHALVEGEPAQLAVEEVLRGELCDNGRHIKGSGD